MEKVLQITSGRGPAECAWVVAQVLKNILEEARKSGLDAQVLSKEDGQENGTVASVMIKFSGDIVADFTNEWVGTIQWIGKNNFRKFHKRKNWFIGIFEVEKVALASVDENEISYQAMRSSGAGGQHVNKVSSAIRATHIPTGISVQAMDSRSQHQNKKLAKERLLIKLNEEKLKLYEEQFVKQWQNQLQVERGNPVKVFSGTDFKKRNENKSYKKQRQALKNSLRNDIDR